MRVGRSSAQPAALATTHDDACVHVRLAGGYALVSVVVDPRGVVNVGFSVELICNIFGLSKEGARALMDL